MFADFQAYFMLVGIAVLGFWLIPRFHGAHIWWLVGISAIAIFRISPVALFVAILMIAIGYIGQQVLSRQRSTPLLYLFVLTLISVVVVQDQLSSQSPILTIGLSFILLKTIIVLVDTFRREPAAAQLGFGDFLLLNLFFPIYAAGPIERPEHFVREKFSASFCLDQFVYGLGRFIIGVFKVQFVAGTILLTIINSDFRPGGQVLYDLGMGQTYLYVLLNFLMLYINFSGYTDMAIGVGRMLSVEIMENFRYPLVAQNIQEFWQRWHLSLGNFINRYLFIPLARFSRGRVNLAIVLSFLAVGLWHEISATYVVWGMLHGVALAAIGSSKRYLTDRPGIDRLRHNWVYRRIANVITISYVAWLSAVANSDSLEQALLLTRSLFGL